MTKCILVITIINNYDHGTRLTKVCTIFQNRGEVGEDSSRLG